MRVGTSILDLVGYTPLVGLTNLQPRNAAKILVKLEFMNPSGSVKDRIAKYMVEAAERRGLLRRDTTIVEATTGNTGIAFAMVAAVKGYSMTVVMPEQMSDERKRIIKAYGANILYTPGGESDVDKCLKKVEEMQKANPKIWVPGQFTNVDNVTAHRLTTGKEILEQTRGHIDAFVAGVGTGGTLTGVAQALKRTHSHARIVAVEPAECAILSGGKWGRHRIEGIGDGFVPKILQTRLIDEVIPVPDAKAIHVARRLTREEGIFGGISSGANVYAALQVAKQLGRGKTVVTMIPDSGQRYLTTDLLKE